jgi:hypothetical protein
MNILVVLLIHWPYIFLVTGTAFPLQYMDTHKPRHRHSAGEECLLFTASGFRDRTAINRSLKSNKHETERIDDGANIKVIPSTGDEVSSEYFQCL